MYAYSKSMAPIFAIAVYAACLTVWSAEPLRLPGARAIIDASAYASLQAALDAVPPEGGKVVLPPGVFEIVEPLVAHQEDLWIEGSGTATHIKNMNETGQPALVLEPKDIADNTRSRIWRVGVTNLRITGNPKSGHGIRATGVNEILIQAVSVSSHGGDGIRLVDCYEDPRICNSLITYNAAVGLHLLRCHDIVVAANQFEENQDALHCIDSFNLCMTGNNLDDHLRHGVVIENTYGSVLSGNMIEECQGVAVILDRDCYGITVSANVIAHNFSGGVHLLDAHGCAISANTFTIVPKDALIIGPESGRITVTGNNFSDSYVGGGVILRRDTDRAASGLVLQETRDVAVSGNVFSGLSTDAVTVKGASERVVFTDNLIRETHIDTEGLADSVVDANLAP
jgi:hypothetical protein